MANLAFFKPQNLTIFFLSLNSGSRYLQWGIKKNLVENNYFDRRKLTD